MKSSVWMCEGIECATSSGSGFSCTLRSKISDEAGECNLGDVERTWPGGVPMVENAVCGEVGCRLASMGEDL